MNYQRHIDGIRALAVLAVIAYHAGPELLPGGFLGVDVFFAISGFVVTAALSQHRDERLGPFLAGFYKRRLTRIVPAALAVLALSCAAWVLLIPRSWLGAEAERVAMFAFAGLANVALTTQADTYFSPRAEFSPFTHTWSLGVEEQFYLVAPFLVFLALRSRRFAIPLLGATSLASLALCAVWTQTDPMRAFYGIASRFWELAAGVLWYLCVWHQRTAAGAPLRRRAWGIAGALLLGAAALFANQRTAPFPWAGAAIAGALLLIGWPGARPRGVAAVLSSAPLQWVGLRSYGLYLWHWPIFVIMRWTWGMESALAIASAIAASLLAAAASYRFVEQPLRRSEPWRRLPALVATACMIAATATVAFGAHTLFEQRHRLSLSEVERHAVDWYAEHHDPTLRAPACGLAGPRYRNLPGQFVVEHLPCPPEATGATASRRLYVLGDSHATMLLPMLQRLAVGESVHVVTHQVPGCQYVNLREPMSSEQPTRCSTEARIALDEVLAQARPGDVALLSSLRLPRFGNQWAFGDSAPVIAQHFSGAQAAARERYVVESDAWIKPLVDRGLHVVLFAPVPIFRAPAFRCVDPWTARNPICSNGLVERRDEEIAFRAPILQALEAIRARHPAQRVSIFDPFDALCPDAWCAAITASRQPLYFDGDHLSRFGNERLYPAFLAHWRTLAPTPAPSGGEPMLSVLGATQRTRRAADGRS